MAGLVGRDDLMMVRVLGVGASACNTLCVVWVVL
jgi:hypothetical protein